jgi:transposase
MTINVIGLDISKETIDAGYLKEGKWLHVEVPNGPEGFRVLDKLAVGGDFLYVMEATGPYYLQAAMYLHGHDKSVSVVNPLVIRRYCQMRLQRAKTDKKDARAIAEYGASQCPKLWTPPSEQTIELQQLQSTLELYNKQKTMSSNQLKAFKATGQLSKELNKELQGQLRTLENRIKRLEKSMYLLAQETYGEVLKSVQSVMGIGLKTATLLCVITDGFTKFEHYKQLIAFVGFSPRIFQSGTSVKGKSKICKMGKSQVRKSLYLCAWSAKHHNKACVEMYNRLKEKGKPEKVIKVAIANKLIKQAFAIAKSGLHYNENFQSKPCF